MKPVAFDYARPQTVEEAVSLLSTQPDAKIIAGGQTLGPMLNLRLAQPALLIDITRISELASVEETADAITLGGTVTHAAIEDRRIAVDPSHGFLAHVAKGIAYRAVRTRGTVGGSLAHADPAADWLSCFTALAADLLIAGPGGRRRTPLSTFMRGALDTDLASDEIVVGISIRKLSRKARCGYHKICRKTGEFAEAIGVAVHDPERSVLRLVAGSTQGRPIVIDGKVVGLSDLNPDALDTSRMSDHLREAGMDDPYEISIHVAALRRAMQGALVA
ncbi:FAD binding domain-containing protein [Leptospira interrogans]